MGKQPATGTKKTKDAISKAAASSSKGGKKKWTKGRVKDKKDNVVYFDNESYKKFCDEAPKMKLITFTTLVDKFRINGSLARKAINHLVEKGTIQQVGDHYHKMGIYTGALKKK